MTTATATPTLLWPHEAISLTECLDAREVLDPETGEGFTVERVDDAIQSAVEATNDREGTRIIDIFEVTWWMLSDDVARFLGISYDEMCEVAP